MHSKLCAQVEYQLPYGEDRQRKGRKGKMEACNENFDTREWVCCTPHSDKWTSLFEVLKVAFEKKKKKKKSWKLAALKTAALKKSTC